MSEKKGIVISLGNDNQEIIELANSLDYKIIEIFIQNKRIPDVNFFVGKGKVDEIKEYIENYSGDIDIIIINGKLKPSQWFSLEKEFNINVYDRIRLILAIFEKRADRKEARLQVKLAQLQYERPFVKELIHRSRSGEHPGFMAGGEYQVDDYFEMIKKQTKKIKESLENIRDEREIRRRHRHISGFYLVSIAGYTNAGKSSLLNLLSQDKIKVEDRLFSTLSTTTRKITQLDIPILITDTVGFIQDLPAIIIEAFHSTLEEIKLADIVLLMIDISEDLNIVQKKLKASLDELVEIGVTAPIIIVFNKIDLISEKNCDMKIDFLKKLDFIKDKKLLKVSINKDKNIDKLLEQIYDSLPRLISFSIKLPANNKVNSFVSWVYEKAKVLNVSYNNSITLRIECNQQIKDKIISKSKKLNGSVLE